MTGCLFMRVIYVAASVLISCNAESIKLNLCTQSAFSVFTLLWFDKMSVLPQIKTMHTVLLIATLYNMHFTT